MFEHSWARGYPPKIIEQPVGELAEVLDRVGRFDYTLDDERIDAVRGEAFDA